MLISMHLPKTAGNSFLKALERKYGQNLYKDYDDMQKIQKFLAGDNNKHELLATPFSESSHLPECIHGHFLAAKFLPYRQRNDAKFITWLREPVQRLISHYNFFRRSYDPATAGPLFRKVIEENWSLEAFCLSDEFRNIYSKYITDFSFNNFDFVGVTEFYDEDLRFLSENILSFNLIPYKLNSAEPVRLNDTVIDPGFRKEIELFHSLDMDLYKQALEVRRQRND
jgi:hypothetical protein